jgi:hypothetical protein
MKTGEVKTYIIILKPTYRLHINDVKEKISALGGIVSLTLPNFGIIFANMDETTFNALKYFKEIQNIREEKAISIQ